MSVDSSFSDLYKTNPREAQKLLDLPDAKIVQETVKSTSLLGGTKVISRIYVGEENYGAIDALVDGILKNPERTCTDIKTAHKLADLYESATKVSDEEKSLRSRIQGVQRSSLSGQLKSLVGSFLEIYKNHPRTANDLLNRDDIQIVEVEETSWRGKSTVTRHIYIEGEDFGPIDALAEKILSNPERTVLDIQIAHKFSKLYMECDRKYDYQDLNEASQASRIERRRVAKGLQQIVYEDFISLLDKGKKVELERLYHQEAQNTFIEISQKTSRNEVTPMVFSIHDEKGNLKEKTIPVRADYMDSLQRGLSHQALAILDQTDLSPDILESGLLEEIRTAQNEVITINKLRADLYDEKSVIEDNLSRIDARITMLYMEGQVVRNKIDAINKLIDENPERDQGDVSELTGQLILLNEEEVDNQRKLQELIVDPGLRNQYDLFLQYKQQEVANEFSLLQSAASHEDADSRYYTALNKAFIMDLYSSLGPDTKHLILDILVFLEQTFSGHIATNLNAHFLDSKCTPKYANPERTITIYPSHVDLRLVLDCSKEFRETGEEIDNLPFGIRATLKVTLGEKTKDTTFLLTAEKLENAPTSRKFSQVYPIIVVPSSMRSGNGTPTSNGSTTRSPTPDSSSSGKISRNDSESPTFGSITPSSEEGDGS
ncbi:MAG: hypothetical protein K2Y01_08380 [Rhabdochlamydiaceae bacterium]|nr:hypothetical protein [Rhabdochlamydiaceae bacterium]